MSSKLLDIQPTELKFIFEVKKQSSSSVQLVNQSDAPVAFKVKTTTPKKYCVRPNVGIVKPKSMCNVIVTMQAQRIAPLDLVCKDKFLVQGTAVPEGTTEEDITSDMFSKDDHKYVEDYKLRVILESPPHSLELSSLSEAGKQIPTHEAPVLKDPILDSVEITNPQNNKSFNSAEDITHQKNKISEDTSPWMNEIIEDFSFPNNTNSEDVSIQKTYSSEDVTRSKANNFENINLQKKVAVDEMVSKMDTSEELTRPKSAEPVIRGGISDLDLVKDIDKMKSKLDELESKLYQAEVTISKLTEERRLSTQERETLRKELATSKSWNGMSKAQYGFPLIVVVLVALGSILLGNLLRC